MSGLKALEVTFMTWGELKQNVENAMAGLEKAYDEYNERCMSSLETFRRFMTPQKLKILMTISRLKPKSIYQLAKMVDRQYPHVLKDCRQLEFWQFVKFIEKGKAKKQFEPLLDFDYDFIRVNSKLVEIYPISEKSNQVIIDAQTA